MICYEMLTHFKNHARGKCRVLGGEIAMLTKFSDSLLGPGKQRAESIKRE